MKNYLFVYRSDFSKMPQYSPEERESITKKWMDWMGSIAAQNKLADRGNRLDISGKVVMHNQVITNGPYAEIKESIGGYSVVKAESYEAAIELAKGCPVFTAGGTVEIREISPL
jgi:hypothetical protein